MFTLWINITTLLNSKISLADYSGEDESFSEPQAVDPHYSYYKPPQHPQEFTQRPPFKRQDLLQPVIQQVEEILGPDSSVSQIQRTNYTYWVISRKYKHFQNQSL